MTPSSELPQAGKPTIVGDTGWIAPVRRTTVATPQQVDQLKRLGYFVLDRAFHPDTMADVISALAVEAGVETPGPIARATSSPGTVLRRFCSHPLLAGLARDLIGPDVRVHRDGPPARDDPLRSAFTRDRSAGAPGASGASGAGAHLTCWVALTDAGPDDGCLQIAQGGHRHGSPTVDLTDAGSDAPCTVTGVDPDSVVDVPVGAGSVVVMSSLTPRRIRRSATDRPALAYVVQYVPDAVIPARPLDGEPAPPGRHFAVVRSGQLTGPS